MQGMIQEFVNLGPLDAYLRREAQTVKTVDLVEAATSLANAVFHLVSLKSYKTSIFIRRHFIKDV